MQARHDGRMVFLALLLLFGTLAYLAWKRRSTTLTPLCRWREDRAAGDWRCATCGARAPGEAGGAPRHCLRKR